MIAVIAVLGTLSAVLHIVFFYLESVAWQRPSVWKIFGVETQEAADTTRPFAYNQGFYNLFLGIGAIVGIVLYGIGASTGKDAGVLVGAGFALSLFTLASMVAAAAVLFTSGGNRRWKAAFAQGLLPLVAVVLLLLQGL